jgi:alkanesulfonate monooxygenase SsuD/methylene tetrahydromethanopterin reductase-like flavin-dependent oxidoreductase (luciferase family)
LAGALGHTLAAENSLCVLLDRATLQRPGGQSRRVSLKASFEQQLTAAQAAERLGFEAFFRSDHFLQIKPGDPSPGPTDSWVTLGAVARETSTIRLGTLVTSATFRLPGPLAIAVAQVDAMSGGRVELGLGSGWFEQEHAAYGIPFPSLNERFDRLEEQFAIVTGLWGHEGW